VAESPAESPVPKALNATMTMRTHANTASAARRRSRLAFLLSCSRRLARAVTRVVAWGQAIGGTLAKLVPSSGFNGDGSAGARDSMARGVSAGDVTEDTGFGGR
jgi:hypothetical protein